ncbi:MAG: hypothetical protein R3B70_06430 [Polyangiaceae bacterium]
MTTSLSRSRKSLLTALTTGIFLASSLAPTPALSQSAEDKAAAEKLYDEGKELLAQKKYAEACKRFEASQRLDPGVGTLLFLADCYETTGRTASAWSTFREAASAAKVAGQPDREQIARDRAAKLDGKLFQLTLTVAAPDTPGLRVMRDGVEVKKAVWGLALPVDPGTSKLEVSAPGKKPWSSSVDIPQSAGTRTVEIPALEDAPVVPDATGSATGTAPPTATVAPTGTAAPPPGGWSTGRKAGLAMGIAGLASIGVGAVFGGLAASQFGDARASCPDTDCGDQDAVDLSLQAGGFADVSTALFIAGGTVLAAGVVVFFVSSPSKGPGAAAPTTSWVSPMVGNGAAGARFGSSF